MGHDRVGKDRACTLEVQVGTRELLRDVGQYELSHARGLCAARGIGRRRVAALLGQGLFAGGIRRFVDEDVGVAGELDRCVAHGRVGAVRDLQSGARRAEYLLRRDRTPVI